MRIGIIILNYNGLELLQTYLPSVVLYSNNHDIYLADNASMDHSISWVEKNYPMVQIIAMNQNRGYAGGYNRAIEEVENEILCLLNSDVRVTAGWCDTIVKRFNIEKELAALQPKIKDDKNPEYFEYAGAAGGFLDRFAYPYCRGRIFNSVEKDLGQYDSEISLDWASGACFFTRKSVFSKLGGFDPDYFAHQEEIDLCWRMRRDGQKIGFAGDVEVFHLGGGTLSNHNPKKTFYNFRNSLFNIVKNEPSKIWVVILFLRMILDGIAALKFLFEGRPTHFYAVINAHVDFYRRLPKFYGKRSFIKNKSQHADYKQINISIVYQYYLRNKNIFSELI